MDFFMFKEIKTIRQKSTNIKYIDFSQTLSVELCNTVSIIKICSIMGYQGVLDELKATFETDVTKDLKWRKEVLHSFIRMLKENYEDLVQAVIEDMGGGQVRPLGEFGLIAETEDAIANMDKWAADVNVNVGLLRKIWRTHESHRPNLARQMMHSEQTAERWYDCS